MPSTARRRNTTSAIEFEEFWQTGRDRPWSPWSHEGIAVPSVGDGPRAEDAVEDRRDMDVRTKRLAFSDSGTPTAREHQVVGRRRVSQTELVTELVGPDSSVEPIAR